jgi:hypothetical protein
MNKSTWRLETIPVSGGGEARRRRRALPLAFYDFEDTFPIHFASDPGIAIVGNSINFIILTFRSFISSITSFIYSSANSSA